MTATLKTAASAYAAAMNAESNLWAQYSEAYAAIRATRDAGESGARIAAAIKGEGYKVSASAVDDWARASSLTRSTVDYVNAMTAVFGEGVIKRAHNVIQEARKNGGGTAAVDMVTKALADLEGDEYALELVKVLKTLKGMGKPKREAQPPTGEDLEDGNEQLEGPNSSASSTPTPPADVVQNALDALRSLRAAIKLGEVEVTADTYADLHTAVAELWEVVKV